MIGQTRPSVTKSAIDQELTQGVRHLSDLDKLVRWANSTGNRILIDTVENVARAIDENEIKRVAGSAMKRIDIWKAYPRVWIIPLAVGLIVGGCTGASIVGGGVAASKYVADDRPAATANMSPRG